MHVLQDGDFHSRSADSNANSNCNVYSHAYANGYCNIYSHAYPDRNPVSFSKSDSDPNCYSVCRHAGNHERPHGKR